MNNVVVVIRNPFEAIYATYATYEATYAKRTNSYHLFGKGTTINLSKLSGLQKYFGRM